MHAASLYSLQEPNFSALAASWPPLAPHLVADPGNNGRSTIDWHDAAAVCALNSALLQHDFGLTLTLPTGFLCPTVASRANYLHWIHDLLGNPVRTQLVWGIDIGTGASAIYPVLGHVLYGWRFVATEIDSAALASAKAALSECQLNHAVTLRQVCGQLPSGASASVIIDALSADPAAESVTAAPLPELWDFCMCNPPFFESLQQKQESSNEHNVCQATEREAATVGGEVQFILRMIDESMTLSARVRWYTSLVGRKSSLPILMGRLRELGIRTHLSTSFKQGRTTRWAIAWSFCLDVVPPRAHVPGGALSIGAPSAAAAAGPSTAVSSSSSSAPPARPVAVAPSPTAPAAPALRLRPIFVRLAEPVGADDMLRRCAAVVAALHAPGEEPALECALVFGNAMSESETECQVASAVRAKECSRLQISAPWESLNWAPRPAVGPTPAPAVLFAANFHRQELLRSRMPAPVRWALRVEHSSSGNRRERRSQALALQAGGSGVVSSVWRLLAESSSVEDEWLIEPWWAAISQRMADVKRPERT